MTHSFRSSIYLQFYQFHLLLLYWKIHLFIKKENWIHANSWFYWQLSWIERKKTWKCEAEGRRYAWCNFTSRKPSRMHCETASEMASLPWSQNNQKENKAHTKVSMHGLGSSWSYLCTENTTTCMSRNIQGGCSTCSPKQSHKWVCT